jgi:hypothetical protein
VIALQTPAARSSDPITSDWAAESVYKPSRVQERILSILLTTGPMTDEAIVREYQHRHTDENGRCVTPQSIRSRRKELVDAGRVCFSGLYSPTINKRLSQEWMLA